MNFENGVAAVRLGVSNAVSFLLDVDADTLNQRLESRPKNAWGKSPEQRELILRLHATKEDIPSDGVVIDATQSLGLVVDQIIQHIEY